MIMLQTFWINTSCVETIQSFTIVILLKRDDRKPKDYRRLQKNALRRERTKQLMVYQGLLYPYGELIQTSKNKKCSHEVPQK